VTSTIADIGQVEPPDVARGTSLLPALEGDFNGHEHVFSSIDDFTCVRNEQYRFTIDNPSGTPCELFDLTNDPGETTNLVDDRDQESLIRKLTQVIHGH
jgi:arylsulfatase A-like enzyme